MIIIDALLGAGILYVFGADCWQGLAVICMVTFLRMAMKVNDVINVIYMSLEQLANEDSEIKEEVK